jgi:hypothetical protein
MLTTMPAHGRCAARGATATVDDAKREVALGRATVIAINDAGIVAPHVQVNRRATFRRIIPVWRSDELAFARRWRSAP